jgi:hypothetical protein
MKRRKSTLYLLILIPFITVHFSCTGAYDAFVNLQRLQFKLGSVDNFSLAGVRLKSIGSISELSFSDAAKLLSAFSNGELPASFTLNVLAKNPNDGTGGTRKTTAVLKSLAWRMFLDDKETISGNIPHSIEIPGVGQASTIPVGISLDLIRFFRDAGYESLLNLALAVGGVRGSSARVTLKATPTVDTFLGPITYPGEITIVEREFRSQ